MSVSVSPAVPVSYGGERYCSLPLVMLVVLMTGFPFCCPAAFGDDYFNRITMASDGRIMRFPHSPISVYIAEPPVPERMRHAYIGDVEDALAQWTGCSEGRLDFEKVDSEDADIRIYWTEELPGLGSDPLGEASLIRFDSGEFYVHISIPLRERPSLIDAPHEELKVVLLHEIGHAIGLWGHSRDPSDIMFRGSSTRQPTRRDKATLLKLLSVESGTSFHENAIAELKSDISREPDAAHLHFWLGTVYADKGRYNQAVMELLTALKLSPDLLKAANRLGRIFQKEGMYKEAIDYYSREVEKQPSPELHGLIGMLYFRQEKYGKAVEYFEKALGMNENFAEARTDALAAYHLWASQLIKDDQVDEAISVLFRALGRFPSSRVILYDLGTAYEAGEQYSKAIEQYKRALESDPAFVAAKSNIASCMNNLGARQMRDGNWESSIELCRQALQWDLGCWEAQANLEAATLGLGREKRQAGLLDEAISYYEAVLNMNPNNPDAYSSLGYALYEKGTYRDALKQFQKALKIDPEFADAKEGLAVVRRKISLQRARIAALLTAVSMLLCLSVIALLKYQRHRKAQTDKEGVFRRA